MLTANYYIRKQANSFNNKNSKNMIVFYFKIVWNAIFNNVAIVLKDFFFQKMGNNVINVIKNANLAIKEVSVSHVSMVIKVSKEIA